MLLQPLLKGRLLGVETSQLSLALAVLSTVMDCTLFDERLNGAHVVGLGDRLTLVVRHDVAIVRGGVRIFSGTEGSGDCRERKALTKTVLISGAVLLGSF